ncbi:retrovirus-related pol polyprotein from transposon TNT 1-94 [Tanacetum coccineum]
MSTLAEYMILSGADNRPPMLDKALYDSRKGRMELYMKNCEHGRMILELVEHGPLIWPTVEENGVTRMKKYDELSATEKIQADCDLKATNIILQGLPPDVYAFVNHHRVSKDLWARVQLLMQGTSLTKKERECKLYDEFDKFAHVKGESLHSYYLRFAQLINDMNVHKMNLEQFQINTKFLNSLPSEWSKFVTDVKLVRDLHTTNFEQLHAYLQSHKLHANEVRLLRERHQDPLALQYSTTYPSSSLAISYPPAQHSNAYSSMIYHDAYPQSQSVPQIKYTFFTVSQQLHIVEFPQIDSGLVVPVFNKGDDPIDTINKMMSFLSTVVSSQFPSTNNQLRNSSNPKQQAIINDGRVTVQPYQGRTNYYATGTSGSRINTADSGGPNSSKQRVLKCFNCRGDGHMARQCTQPKRKRDAAWYKEKVLLVEAQGMGKVLSEEELEFLADLGIPEGPITHSIITHHAAYQANDLDAYDSECDDITMAKVALMANLCRYGSDVLSEVLNPDNTHNAMLNQSVQEMQYSVHSNYDTNSFAQQDVMILSVIEQMSVKVTDITKVNEEHLNANKSLSAELERYKERVGLLEERHNMELSTRDKLIIDDVIREKNAQFADLDKEINKKKARNIDREIVLEKKVKELDNIVHKMGFQNPLYLKRAQQIRPMLYDGDVIAKGTNVISIPDSKETLILPEEIRSKMNLKQSDPEVEKHKIKPVDYAVLNQLSIDFSKRFVPQTELFAEQAFCLLKSMTSLDPSSSYRPTKVEVPNELPKVSMVNTSLKKLKCHRAGFDVVVKERTTATAITEGLWEFEHTKACFRDEIIPFAVEQHLLFHDIMNVVVNNSVNVNSFVAMKDYMNVSDMFVEKCQKCLELETELVKKDKVINDLSTRFLNLEKHCISLEVDNQLNQEIFQRENSVSNESALTFDQFFELNELKAQLQEKDTTIKQLKEKVKDLRKNPDRVKKEYDAIETINIELEHRKHVVDSVAPKPKAITIAQGMFKIAVEPLPPKLFKNKESHIDYIHKSRENANVLREIVEEVRASNPLDGELDLAYKYVEHIQEELVYVHDTCPCLATSKERLVTFTQNNKDSKTKPADPFISSQHMEKIVDVTPKNKQNKVSFTEPLTSSSNNHKQVESPKTSDSNTHVLPSTGLKSSTKVCRSQPTGLKSSNNAPVAPKNRQEIGKCNMRIDPKMKRPKETTYQVVLDALTLTTCYPAFLITVDVPTIYMHQFWDTVYKHDSSYQFKIDNQKFAIDLEVFREILDICPRIEVQSFTDPPFKEEVLAFFRHLGHTGEIKYLTDITVDHLHQPWREFAAIINKCLSGKDLAYQIENKDAKKTDKMYYPRFTKAIISHYIKKNPSISMRNKMFMHTARDDTILGILNFISKNEDVQVYGALMPKVMTNQEMLSSESFQTYYAIAIGVAPPKTKKLRKANSSKSSEETLTRKSLRIKRSAKVSSAKSKKKAPARADTGKTSGSGAGTDEGTSTKLGVPDVPKVDSENEAESWGDSDDEDNDDENKYDNESDDGNDDDDDNDDDSDNGNDGDDKNDEGDDDADDNDEQKEEEEEYADDIDFYDSEDDEEKNEEEEDQYEMLYRDVNVNLQHEDVDMTTAERSVAQPKDQEPLFNLENVSLNEYTLASVMDTAAQQTSSLVITTTSLPPSSITPPPQQATPPPETTTSSPINLDPTTSASDLPDFSSLVGYVVQTAFHSYKVDFEKEAQAKQDRFIEIIENAVKELVKDEVKGQLNKILSKKIADFVTPFIKRNVADSHERVVLDKSASQQKSTYKAVASLTEFELKKILLDKMHDSESYRAAQEHRDLYDSLAKSYKLDKDLFDTYGEVYSLKRDREDKDKDEDPFARSDRGKKRRKSGKKAEPSQEPKSKGSKSTSSSKGPTQSPCKSSSKFSYAEESRQDSSEPHDQEFVMGNTDDQPADEAISKDDWWKKPKKPPTPDHEWNKRQAIDVRPSQTWISNIAKDKEPPSSFDELMNTLIDFSAIIGVTHIEVDKRFDYGYLKEIIVRREDQQLYTFKEGDFPRLNMRDIEDLLLLLIQKKISNLGNDVLFDLNVALWMFTRRIVILKRVEDLQLGVESYEKKLNITRP